MKLYCLVICLFILASCAQIPKAPVAKVHSTDTDMHIHPSENSDEDMQFTGSRAVLAANSVGIQRVIVLSNSYSKMAYRDYARTQNAFVAKEAKKNPTKIAGACAVNPLMDWAQEEMRRCKQDGLKVLKLHTMASGMDLHRHADLVELKKILSLASELQYTVLIHGAFPKKTRGNESDILLKTLSDFPKIRFILGHMMGKEFEVLKNFKHPNFLVEVSAVPIFLNEPADQKKLVAIMKEVGMKKFVFGSDWPVYHPAETLHALQALPLSTSELDDLVYNNAKALDDLF